MAGARDRARIDRPARQALCSQPGEKHGLDGIGRQAVGVADVDRARIEMSLDAPDKIAVVDPATAQNHPIGQALALDGMGE